MHYDPRALTELDDAPLTLPAPPGEPTPQGFPLLATTAPVLLSVALFVVTRSPFALLFAILGPVVALASLGDSTRQSRRTSRRDHAEFEAECQRVADEIVERHERERRRLDAEFPTFRQLVEHPAALWNRRRHPTAVMLGRGAGRSGLRIDGATRGRADGRIRALLDPLAATGARIEDIPIAVDGIGGIGFQGSKAAADAAARAAVLQVAAALPPDAWSITVNGDPSGPWSWLAELPHPVTFGLADPMATVVDFDASTDSASTGGATGTGAGAGAGVTKAGSTERVRIAVIPPGTPIPRGIAHVVAVGAGMLRTGSHDAPLRPELATVEEATVNARLMTRAADDAGLSPSAARLPHSVAFASLPRDIDRGGVTAAIGRTADGPWTVDLVADGPHAVIGGTTGSGKSELLSTWMLALARTYPPDEVNLLLVDFKGGATFAPLARLPHSVGVITDLDDRQARRALESLRAEMLFREGVLGGARVRSIELLPGDAALPRLVIVVDEFAAVTSDFPDLHHLFADLAARGRSLGIHLVLCTQRPASALRDAILANCTLRISLRVNDPADSTAMIGTTEAASLPRRPVGRALVSVGGAIPAAVQVAIADADDIAAAAAPPPAGLRRPWCDPLPELLTRRELERRTPTRDGERPFGLLDLPSRQRQDPAFWRPAQHGHVLVIGAFASGRSSAVRALAECADAAMLPNEVEAVWDAVMSALADLRTGRPPPRVLAIDDLDSLIARLSHEHARELVDALTGVLRDGPAAGLFAVISTRSLPSMLQSVAVGCDSRLILRVADRTEHVVAGGSSADFDARLPPGGGFWRGDRIQVLASSPSAARSRIAVELDFPAGGVSALVTPVPQVIRDRLDSVGRSVRSVELGAATATGGLVIAEPDEHLVIVGDADAWQGAWSLLPSVRATGRLLFYRCGTADFRAITRSRELPPPLGSPDEQVWVLATDGTASRATVGPVRRPG